MGEKKHQTKKQEDKQANIWKINRQTNEYM